MAEVNRSPSRRSSTRGALDLHHPRPGRHLPGPGIAVAHHQALPGGVERVGVGLEVGPALGQQRHRQHLLGCHPAQLVEADLQGLGVINRDRGGVMD